MDPSRSTTREDRVRRRAQVAQERAQVVLERLNEEVEWRTTEGMGIGRRDATAEFRELLQVDPGDLNGREVVEVEEIIIDEVVHEGLVGGNGGVEQFGLDESLIEALIGGEDVVGEAEDGQVVTEAENNPGLDAPEAGHDHSEVGAMEEVSVSGDAPLSDTIDLTDSPGPSRCASRNKISNVTVVDISNSPITVVVISNDGKYIVGGHWSPYSAQCAWTR